MMCIVSSDQTCDFVISRRKRISVEVEGFFAETVDVQI